tara:strand:- start:62 stop:556 length:495 start_codon:yes stop_codon:yes gene_type:complete
MSKPGKSLKGLCKRLKVRLTVKRGKKRVYKSIKVLKAQCKRKKKKKKVKRKRKFGTGLFVNKMVSSSIKRELNKNKDKEKYSKEYINMREKATDKLMEEFWEYNDEKNYTDDQINKIRNAFDRIFDREWKKKVNNAARGAGLIGLGTAGYIIYNRLRKNKLKKK